MTLVRFGAEHRVTMKSGIKRGIAYVHLIGALACVSGFGDTTEDALFDAISRLPGGRA